MWSPPRTDAIEKPKPIREQAQVAAIRLRALRAALLVLFNESSNVFQQIDFALNVLDAVSFGKRSI